MSRLSLYSRLPLALAILSITTGCQGFTDPSPMPRGYVFHGNLYKTIPDSEPDSIGIPYTLSGAARSAASWRAAARDLTARMIAKGALNGGLIFITPQSPEGPFPAAFDHALRSALLEKGFVLADTPGQGPVLSYKIEKNCDRIAAEPQHVTEPPANAPTDIALVKAESAPTSPDAPTPLDVPPESAHPLPPTALPETIPDHTPEPIAPVTDGLSLTLMSLAPGESRSPEILASESGIYVIPGADYYDWSEPLVDWRPITWGLR